MRFDLTDEQKALRETLDAFFAERFSGAEGVAAVANTTLDKALREDITALGMGGIMVPADQGGVEMGLLTLCLVSEVLGRYAVPSPIIANALAAWLIAEAGSTAQRGRWMAPLIEGQTIAALALAEDAGWMADDWSTGKNAKGVKRNVERADAAGIFIIGLAGGALGIVEADADGLVIEPIDTLDRTRPLFDVQMKDVAIEPISEDGAVGRRLVDAMLILHAADALGAAHAAQDRAVAYAKERKQFGQLIGSFQALKHQLADISVEIEPARSLCWYAAHAWDTERDDSHRIAALTKAHISEIAVNCARVALEAHGGIGYTWEHPIHLFLKRAMHDRTVFGTPNLHRERAAALAGW